MRRPCEWDRRARKSRSVTFKRCRSRDTMLGDTALWQTRLWRDRVEREPMSLPVLNIPVNYDDELGLYVLHWLYIKLMCLQRKYRPSYPHMSAQTRNWTRVSRISRSVTTRMIVKTLAGKVLNICSNLYVTQQSGRVFAQRLITIATHSKPWAADAHHRPGRRSSGKRSPHSSEIWIVLIICKARENCRWTGISDTQ
jgi:hypothetical protein